MSSPSYYDMGHGEDLFEWVGNTDLNVPFLLVDTKISIRQAFALWFTGFRYARRALWKGGTLMEIARDCRKTADCFNRLADYIESV